MFIHIFWGFVMKKRILVFSLFLMLFFSVCVSAHVPYLEHRDYSEDNPLVLRKIVTQSKAFYSWLENDGLMDCDDIDVYKFSLKKPTVMYLEIIVPVVDDYYEDFCPWYALVGPGLPEPSQSYPFDIPDGYGIIVKENVEPGEERETFYEPFGGKSYYKGPIFEEKLDESGDYFVYCWDPYKKGGDYTLVIGNKEIWGPLDILRALIYTPLIRMDYELHIY